MPIRNSATLNVVAPETRILEIFGDKDLIPWLDFVSEVVSILKTNSNTVEKLKHILCVDDATIEKNKWLNFMEWFSPLNDGSGNTYISTGEMANTSSLDGYSIEEIADIVGPK
jgi:hypothetical protein